MISPRVRHIYVQNFKTVPVHLQTILINQNLLIIGDNNLLLRQSIKQWTEIMDLMARVRKLGIRTGESQKYIKE